ncbi:MULTISPECIES: hypothetical protein [Aliiruegeria]|uniref:Uncharacterized protein n=1 Tax=Aliiruegeria lutimaris TaxID=571298 RepID=A0A1G8U0W9_9RHOB|nr:MULTISPECIES: hypothetical protein [Aliiruegeria]NDR57039.1 hypothetical protein [Pseudoruegeria sp. M32A2M]SDJ46755.1 hypothetical protein SAMN04488026_10185 [Aliiruegeria lutimaris]
MTSNPVELGTKRSAESSMVTHIRRHSLQKFEVDRENLRERQEELEATLLVEPAMNWRDAAVKVQYLIRRYSETAEAQDASRQELIQSALDDLARLSDTEVTNQ